MKKGKYLITGCAGFIGSHLVSRLHKKYNLTLVDDFSEGSKKNLPIKLRSQTIKKKIQDISSTQFKKLNGIIHLAAQSSVPYSMKNFFNSSANNILSSLKIFEMAKKYSIPIVYASSSAIYGNLPKGYDTKEKFSISSPYAQDKMTLENYARMMFDVFNISSVGLRFFNVYGPRQNANSPYAAVIPIFIDKMKKNLPVTINGGHQTRDFIFVDDVVEIIALSMKRAQSKKVCDVFNVGTGRSINIDYLFKIIKQRIPNKSKIIKKSLDKFDPKKSSGNFNKLKKHILNKNFTFTKLEEGIDKILNN